MPKVHAVKEEWQRGEIERQLLEHYSEQYRDIWKLGVNLGLRISDLLSIKIDDLDLNSQAPHVRLIEKKTKKYADIPLNDNALIVINRILEQHPDSVYLFQSRSSNRMKGKTEPLKRAGVSNAFKHVGDNLGIRLGTHSMRKTLGYTIYQKTKDIALVMAILRHSSASETLKYIGIEKEDKDRAILSLNL